MGILKNAFTNPIQTGAIMPSSKELLKLIIQTAKISTRRCVVEYGSGTGVFTKEIRDKLDSDALFFCLETNKEFVDATKKKCPEAIVYHDSAEYITKYLKKNGRTNCDCVISSLPWAIFKPELQERILQATYEALEKGGVFLTYAYLQGMIMPGGKSFKEQLHKTFKTVRKTKVVWKNLPPAFVYACKK